MVSVTHKHVHTCMNSSLCRILSGLTVMLALALTLLAAKPEDFTNEQIDGIWKEVWKSSDPKIKEPKIEKLSEGHVVERMVGTWAVMFGVIPDRLMISLSTNRLVEVTGQKDGAAWKKKGQWRVISDKLVLFLNEDAIPSFIFKSGRHDYVFDPWAKTMMSELNREK